MAIIYINIFIIDIIKIDIFKIHQNLANVVGIFIPLNIKITNIVFYICHRL